MRGKRLGVLELKVAGGVLDKLQEDVWKILWDCQSDVVNDERTLLPIMQEEAEYKILSLKLSEGDKIYYLNRIGYLMGEYGE